MTKLRAIFLLLFSRTFYLAVRGKERDLTAISRGLVVNDAYLIQEHMDKYLGDTYDAESGLAAAKEILNNHHE